MTDLICFEQLYRDYAAEMYAVCYKYSGDTVLSADAVQDVFISLWERKDSLSIDNPQHYLLRAAKLKLLEYHRSESKRLELYRHIAAVEEAAENRTENDVVSKALAEEFRRQVQQLPEKQREAFRMQQEQNMTDKQVADELRISERTVNNYISLATTKLKHVLKTGLHLFFLKISFFS